MKGAFYGTEKSGWEEWKQVWGKEKRAWECGECSELHQLHGAWKAVSYEEKPSWR